MRRTRTDLELEPAALSAAAELTVREGLSYLPNQKPRMTMSAMPTKMATTSPVLHWAPDLGHVIAVISVSNPPPLLDVDLPVPPPEDTSRR